MLQHTDLHPQIDQLHLKHGDSSLHAIYGAGQITSPKLFLIFMNPTGRNISAHKTWQGLQAPWLGTKNIWKLLGQLGVFTNTQVLESISSMRPDQWTPQFSIDLYNEVANNSLYITNIAKCTHIDARHVADSVYKEFLPLLYEEIELIKPQAIVTFGNQVSSITLGKPISVSKYPGNEYEELALGGSKYTVYPTYYPVGQGMRNIKKAIERLNNIISI
ncbi:MAG: hypothetical protein Fur003_0760 [Candidatus Dojkabacteria bacterium]